MLSRRIGLVRPLISTSMVSPSTTRVTVAEPARRFARQGNDSGGAPTAGREEPEQYLAETDHSSLRTPSSTGSGCRPGASRANLIAYVDSLISSRYRGMCCCESELPAPPHRSPSFLSDWCPANPGGRRVCPSPRGGECAAAGHRPSTTNAAHRWHSMIGSRPMEVEITNSRGPSYLGRPRPRPGPCHHRSPPVSRASHLVVLGLGDAHRAGAGRRPTTGSPTRTSSTIELHRGGDLVDLAGRR